MEKFIQNAHVLSIHCAFSCIFPTTLPHYWKFGKNSIIFSIISFASFNNLFCPLETDVKKMYNLALY